MSDQIKAIENIQTGDKEVLDTKNAKFPQAESYAEFWSILTNQKQEALYTKISNVDDITIVPDAGNNPNTPEKNKYAIQKKQQVADGTQKDVQLCYVVGKSKIENFLGQYIRSDIKQYKEMVQIQINETAEKTETIMATNNELEDLAGAITEFEYTPEGIKDFFKKTEALTKDVDKDYDASVKVIKDRIKNRKDPTLLEKNMLKLLEHKADTDIDNIKQVKSSISGLKKEYRKETNVDARKQNTQNTLMQLLYYKDQSQKLSTVLHNEAALKNFVENPDTYMDIPVETSQDADFVRNIYDNMSKERFKINELMTDANFKNIKDKNGQTLQDYLTKTLGDGATAQEPFVPSAEYQTAYNDVLITYPQLHAWMTPDVTDKTTNQAPDNTNRKTEQIYADPTKIEQYRRGSGGLLDKLTPSPLTDLIDKQNIQPQTKEKLKTLSGLVFLVGAGILARKTVSNARKAAKGDKEANLGWVAAGAVLFGGAYISSGNIFDFKNLGKDVANRFSSSPDNIPGNEKVTTPEEETVGGINSINIIFAGMNGLQINAMLTPEDSDGKRKIDYDAAKVLIEASNASNKSTRLQMIESLRNCTNQDLVPIALNAFGLSSEKLQNNPSKKYEDLTETGLNNLVSLIKDMKKNNYTKWNPEMKDEIYKFMRGESGTSLDKLAKMGAFEKDETLTDNNTLKTNIDGLTILTTKGEKDELYKQSLKVFTELQKNTDYKGEFKFVEKAGVLYLETYGKQTAINTSTRTMGNLPLYTTYQTLKAANLTNRIQDLFAGKSRTDKPFNISGPGRDIEFEKTDPTSLEGRKNPRQFVKDKVDDEVVAAGRRGTLKEIAPSLEDQKEQYVAFLNSLPGRKK